MSSVQLLLHSSQCDFSKHCTGPLPSIRSVCGPVHETCKVHDYSAPAVLSSCCCCGRNPPVCSSCCLRKVVNWAMAGNGLERNWNTLALARKQCFFVSARLCPWWFGVGGRRTEWGKRRTPVKNLQHVCDVENCSRHRCSRPAWPWHGRSLGLSKRNTSWKARTLEKHLRSALFCTLPSKNHKPCRPTFLWPLMAPALAINSYSTFYYTLAQAVVRFRRRDG